MGCIPFIKEKAKLMSKSICSCLLLLSTQCQLQGHFYNCTGGDLRAALTVRILDGLKKQGPPHMSPGCQPRATAVGQAYWIWSLALLLACAEPAVCLRDEWIILILWNGESTQWRRDGHERALQRSCHRCTAPWKSSLCWVKYDCKDLHWSVWITAD